MVHDLGYQNSRLNFSPLNFTVKLMDKEVKGFKHLGELWYNSVNGDKLTDGWRWWDNGDGTPT